MQCVSIGENIGRRYWTVISQKQETQCKARKLKMQILRRSPDYCFYSHVISWLIIVRFAISQGSITLNGNMPFPPLYITQPERDFLLYGLPVVLTICKEYIRRSNFNYTAFEL
jgi:hypothetical protein